MENIANAVDDHFYPHAMSVWHHSKCISAPPGWTLLTFVMPAVLREESAGYIWELNVAAEPCATIIADRTNREPVLGWLFDYHQQHDPRYSEFRHAVPLTMQGAHRGDELICSAVKTPTGEVRWLDTFDVDKDEAAWQVSALMRWVHTRRLELARRYEARVALGA